MQASSWSMMPHLHFMLVVSGQGGQGPVWQGVGQVWGEEGEPQDNILPHVSPHKGTGSIQVALGVRLSLM